MTRSNNPEDIDNHWLDDTTLIASELEFLDDDDAFADLLVDQYLECELNDEWGNVDWSEYDEIQNFENDTDSTNH